VEAEALTGQIIGCAMRVHSILGPGFLESVYRKALRHELVKAALNVAEDVRLPVQYDGIIVGQFEADLLVEWKVMLELKQTNHSLLPTRCNW